MHSTRRLLMAQFASAALAALLVLAATLLMAPQRTTAQGSAAVTSGLLPRFISLSTTEARLDGDAVFTPAGGSTLGGIYMPKTTFSRVHIAFTLPPDYNPGSDVTLRIVWANGLVNATNCTFDFWSNVVPATRPGVAGPAYVATARFSNGSEQIALAAGATAQLVRAEVLTIQGSGGGKALQPGDALYMQFSRRGNLAGDTCAGTLVITGLDATYQGLTTYVPLIAK